MADAEPQHGRGQLHSDASKHRPAPKKKLWQLSTACPDQGAYMATAGVVLISLQSKVVLLSSKRQ